MYMSGKREGVWFLVPIKKQATQKHHRQHLGAQCKGFQYRLSAELVSRYEQMAEIYYKGRKGHNAQLSGDYFGPVQHGAGYSRRKYAVDLYL